MMVGPKKPPRFDTALTKASTAAAAAPLKNRAGSVQYAGMQAYRPIIATQNADIAITGLSRLQAATTNATHDSTSGWATSDRRSARLRQRRDQSGIAACASTRSRRTASTRRC